MLSGRLVPLYRPPTSCTHFVQHKGSTQLTEISNSKKGLSNSTYFTSMVDRNNYTNVFLSQKSSHGIKFQLQLQKDLKIPVAVAERSNLATAPNCSQSL